MMQDYATEKSRNTMRAAGGKLINGNPIPGPVGSNQEQGKGEIPGKVSVPMPGINKTQPQQKGGMKKNVPGFQGGEIPGKV